MADSYLAAFAADPDGCFRVTFNAAGDEFDRSVPAEAVPCSEPHNQQRCHIGDLTDGVDDPYPGEEALADRLWAECDAAFLDVYGAEWDVATSLAQWILLPDEAEWAAGIRTFTCSVATVAVGEIDLVGDASFAGLTLPGHLLATNGLRVRHARCVDPHLRRAGRGPRCGQPDIRRPGDPRGSIAALVVA